VVVGFSYHFDNYVRKDPVCIRHSIEYRTRLVQYLKDHSFKASARPEHLPDDDFLYLTKAKFLPGGGGFSSLIEEICGGHGGQVFLVKQD
jgi:hypothetical protein